MDKIDIRNMHFQDLSAEAVLKKAQDNLREVARRERMNKPTGIIAEIDSLRADYTD